MKVERLSWLSWLATADALPTKRNL